jgi:hypothetical protein
MKTLSNETLSMISGGANSNNRIKAKVGEFIVNKATAANQAIQNWFNKGPTKQQGGPKTSSAPYSQQPASAPASQIP